MGDGVALSKGDFYTSLREQYVIFLTPKDIFNRGFPVYHFENRAREDSNITLNDLTYKILSFAPNPLRLGNAQNWSLLSPCRIYYIFEKYEKFSDPIVKAYMKYFATRDTESRETETINNQVSFYKTDTFIRNKYMTYEFDLHESREKGRMEGKAEGIAETEAKALEEKKAIAKGFRDDGFPLEAISKRTGFTIEEIKAL